MPLCLGAAVGADAGSARTIAWRSTRRDVRTSAGLVALRLESDLVTLTLNDKAFAIATDDEGRPITFSAWTIDVKGLPDCNAPAFLFIVQRGRSDTEARSSLFDPARKPTPSTSPIVDFPGRYDADTVVALGGGTLTVTSGAGERAERTLRYYPDPVAAFVLNAAREKYVTLIGQLNAQFFRNAAANETLRADAGDEWLEALATRTAGGRIGVFQGRYLVVSGSTAGDFDRHGAVIVDMVKDSAHFVACDDDGNDAGALVAASQADVASLERGGEDILAAFRSVGFTLVWGDDNRLACDGECHGER